MSVLPPPYNENERIRVFGTQEKRAMDYESSINGRLHCPTCMKDEPRIKWLDEATHRLNATIDQRDAEIAHLRELLATLRDGADTYWSENDGRKIVAEVDALLAPPSHRISPPLQRNERR